MADTDAIEGGMAAVGFSESTKETDGHDDTNGEAAAAAEDKPSSPDSNWSRDKLMGKSVSFKGLSAETANGGESASTGGSSRKLAKMGSKKKSLAKAPKDDGIDPDLWGRPGHLTEEEANTYFKFQSIVDSRGGDFADTVYCFGREEGEVYTLCRWLRARKFVFEDVMLMVEEATKCRASPKSMGFYPDPKTALGCDQAYYAAQYPQVYSGFAKNGSPLFISKVGVLNYDAVECLTTVSSIVKYHWHVMVHDFAIRLREHKKKDPRFKRFECVCVLDLEHLAMSQLNSKSLAIVKEQAAIDSLCFPETLNKMYIINSPRFFSATWSMVKGWLDARTANKVEVISSRKQWEKALLECVDADQLPSDYGGTGPYTKDTMEKESFTGKLKRMHTEVLYLRGSGSVSYDVYPDEELEVSIHTRSTVGAKWTVHDAKNKNGTKWANEITVKHNSDNLELPPTEVVLTHGRRIKGPASVAVKGDSLGSRFSTRTANFLVVMSVYNP